MPRLDPVKREGQMGRRLVFVTGILLFTLSVLALSGTPQQPQFPQAKKAIQVESDLVVVDATVRDRKDNLVSDLKKEEFRIFEDNVPQEIVTFAVENIPVGPAQGAVTPAAALIAPAAAAKPATAEPQVVNLSLKTDEPPAKEDLANKRLIILFFDLSSLATEDLIRSVDTARDFVTKQAGPQDLLAIATYSSILQLVQDFTNDHGVLLNVLNGLSSPESGESTAADLGDQDTSSDVFVPDTGQFDVFNTDRRLAAIETLAKMYREFPERKSLLYFSSGVTTTGVENNAQIRSTVDSATRSNLSIYPVDSRGLVALPPGGDASQGAARGTAMFTGAATIRQRSNLAGSQETMTTLAHDTGGKEFTDTNDLSLAIQQAQADTQSYYVLGYFSTNSKQDGKYRKIRVEVNRPDLRVEHRPGYFASKAWNQLNQQERDLQLQQALNVDRPFNDVPLILQADYFRNDDKTSIVPVSIELDGDGVTFTDKGVNRQAKFEFLVQVVDPKGRVPALARDNVQVSVPADKVEKVKAGGIYYSTGFEVKPGDYRLKFLVRDDGSGKLGSFEEPIHVPPVDLKTLDTSSIILGNRLVDAAGAGAASGITHQGAMRRFQDLGFGYNPLVTGDKRIIPSVGNIFLNGQTVYVYFQVYGAAVNHESQKPVIATYLMLMRDNTKILESKPEIVQDWTKQGGGSGFGGMPGQRLGGTRGFGGPGGFGGASTEDRKGEATVAIALPLKSLKKGTYTLQIHVWDTIADTHIYRRVPIVIQ